MYCRECGGELRAGLAHCPYCGVEWPTRDFGIDRQAAQGVDSAGDRAEPRDGLETAADRDGQSAVDTSDETLDGFLDATGLDLEVDEFWGEVSQPDSDEPYQIELPDGKGPARRSWIPVLIGCGAAALAAVALGFLLMDPFGLFTPASAIIGEEPAASEPLDGSPDGQPGAGQSPGAETDGADAAVGETAPAEDLGYGDFEADYLLPEASTRAYTREELEKLDSKVLWYARNEMYALHGKGFRTDELREYFESKPWYEATYTADEFDGLPEQLNEYELANEELMTQIEQERNSPYLH